MSDSKVNLRKNNFNVNKKITLDLLSTLEEDGNQTQRTIASELGIALGLANAYLKKSIEKGLVKIRQVPKKRYYYYITPKGFSEKAKLTAEYFVSSFDFFRKARIECEKVFNNAQNKNIKNIVISDISELAEIAILSSLDKKINLVGIIDNEKNTYKGLNVYENFKSLKNIDAVLLTSVNDTQKRYDELLKEFSKSKILVPSILKLRDIK